MYNRKGLRQRKRENRERIKKENRSALRGEKVQETRYMRGVVFKEEMREKTLLSKETKNKEKKMEKIENSK